VEWLVRRGGEAPPWLRRQQQPAPHTGEEPQGVVHLRSADAEGGGREMARPVLLCPPDDVDAEEANLCTCLSLHCMGQVILLRLYLGQSENLILLVGLFVELYHWCYWLTIEALTQKYPWCYQTL
jgi:hypothetical protein